MGVPRVGAGILEVGGWWLVASSGARVWVWVGVRVGAPRVGVGKAPTVLENAQAPLTFMLVIF